LKQRTPTKLINNTYEQIAYIEDFTREVHHILHKFGAHRSDQSNMLSRIRACGQEEAQKLYDLFCPPPHAYSKETTKATRSNTTTQSSLSNKRKQSSNQNTSPSVKKTKRNHCQDALSSSTENLHQLLLKEVPAPRNGKQYKVSEACEMYSNFESSKLTKTQVLRFIIEKTWIPVNKTQFHDNYRKTYESLISENKASLAQEMKWATCAGRKRIVPATRMIEAFSTKTVNQCQDRERSNKFPRLNKGKANQVNLLDGTVKPGCSDNYIAMLYRLRNEKVKMRAMCAYDDIEDDVDIDSMDIDAEEDDDEDDAPLFAMV